MVNNTELSFEILFDHTLLVTILNQHEWHPLEQFKINIFFYKFTFFGSIVWFLIAFLVWKGQTTFPQWVVVCDKIMLLSNFLRIHYPCNVTCEVTLTKELWWKSLHNLWGALQWIQILCEVRFRQISQEWLFQFSKHCTTTSHFTYQVSV